MSRFDIEDVSLSIEFQKLALPADKSKYKRFETDLRISPTAPRSAAP